MDAIVNAIDGVLQFAYDNVLSIIMMVLLMGVGIFLLIRIKALQFRKFGYAMKSTVGSLFDKSQHKRDKGSVSPFQAVTTALAGTIGTGSIAGLATALVSGGPGAVFWMWISALLGMLTKYAEIVLAVKFREKNEKGAWVGGPMYYIKNGLHSKWLAVVFAVFAMVACIGTGNITQSNAVTDVVATTVKNVSSVEQLPEWVKIVIGLLLTGIVALVILGGVKRIASVNEKLVPAMAIFFIVGSIVVLCINITRIPHAFALIFTEAFNFKAAFGGVAGYGIIVAMRYGIGRGVFTNEAGLGSAPIAHSAANTNDPVKQGFWGMFEVFVTTIVICTMSALVILTSTTYAGIYSTVDVNTEIKGAVLSMAAFNDSLPVVGNFVVAIATVFFSLSTIFGWAYYGEVCASYVFNKRKNVTVTVYRIVYVIFVFIGAVVKIDVVWHFADCFNVLMAVPNLIALVALSKIVLDLTKEHFDKKKSMPGLNAVGETGNDGR